MSQSLGPGGPLPGWRVDNVAVATGQDSTGRFTTGKLVSFVLDSGVTGSVFIPDSQFNPDTVKQAIMVEASKLHQVSNLSYGQ